MSFLGLIWFTTTMTLDHAVLTIIWTAYIYAGSYFKDKRMIHFVGDGLIRCSVASKTAAQGATPSARNVSLWTTRITEFRIKILISANTPRIATNPRGAPDGSNAASTPIKHKGATATIKISR